MGTVLRKKKQYTENTLYFPCVYHMTINNLTTNL